MDLIDFADDNPQERNSKLSRAQEFLILMKSHHVAEEKVHKVTRILEDMNALNRDAEEQVASAGISMLEGELPRVKLDNGLVCFCIMKIMAYINKV